MTLVMVVLSPVLLYILTLHQPERRLAIRGLLGEFWRQGYAIHLATYFGMVSFKATIDRANEPLKGLAGDYTHLLYAAEGRLTWWIQRAFEHPVLTDILNFHYLFIYLFIIAFTPIYYAYVQERDMVDKAVLNYVMIYVLAVPWYLFLNVEVTSTFIPGMHALLYHDSARYYEFFSTHDPLDNAVPSLHIAIPAGLLFIHWLHVKQQGIRMREWRHRPYHLFILVNTVIFGFSILYLGIHWLIDTAFGILLGFGGALFVHSVQPRLRAWLRPGADRPKPREALSQMSFQAVAVVLLVGLLLVAMDVREADTVTRPNIQLGPQDVNLDVFEPVREGESIAIRVATLGDQPAIEGVLAKMDETHGAIAEGRINWTWLEQRFPVTYFPPNTTTELGIDEPETWYVLILHNPVPIEEFDEQGRPDAEHLDENAATVLVRARYPGDVLPLAILLSVPSLWATAYVIQRQVRLRIQGRPWYDGTVVPSEPRPTVEERQPRQPT